MTYIVEIGSLREKVEVLDEPLPRPGKRVGRIKHRNGENVAVDIETFRALIERAEQARQRKFPGLLPA